MIRCGLADDHDYRTPDFQNQILYILCIDVNNSCNSRGGGAAPSGSTAGCALVLCKPNMVYTVPPNVGATLVVAR